MMHIVLATVAILATLVRSEMEDIVRPEDGHPLEALHVVLELNETHRAADGVAMNLIVTNKSKSAISFEEPIFSAFLVDMNGAPLNDANAANRFSCAPRKENGLKIITLAPSKSWRSSHVIQRVLMMKKPDPPAAAGVMVSPTFTGPAVPVPPGAYDVYSLMLIAVPRRESSDPEQRMLRAQTRVSVQ